MAVAPLLLVRVMGQFGRVTEQGGGLAYNRAYTLNADFDVVVPYLTKNL